MFKFNVLTDATKLASLALLIVFISSCNFGSKNNSNNKIENGQIQKQTFLIENNHISKEIISKMIEKSGIRKGGYVVIITNSFDDSESIANNLKQKFYNQEITAVHIINLELDSSIKKTELIAIENASIIYIPDGNKSNFMKLDNNSLLKKPLLNAYNNGCLLAGNESIISSLGDYQSERE